MSETKTHRDLTPEYLKWQAKITIMPVEINELREENAKLKHDKEKVNRYNLKQELGKRILITQILLNEEPVVEFRPSFIEGLELDAFFQKYRIALEVHQFFAISKFTCPSLETQLLPNPENCAEFFQCEHGIPIMHQCPPPLHFDPDNKRCEWPHIANCVQQ
ncbi:hypothetical protein Glove_87g48 [Diversispora epigaea]|uniref:Chitin-binding type-2 domain-containing protein n=1 Tax=Diversispora epigaea TaxID=1348612 RepID=A0A397J8E3_9GLOM|nr:hypothetical protein Glove_87g48 [Diversispora epigaea]